MNVSEELRITARKLDQTKPAVIVNDEPVSFPRLESLVNFMASALIGLGVRPGDTVALELCNSLEYIATYFAILRVGGVVLCIDPRIKHEERAFLFEDARPKVWVFDPEKAEGSSGHSQKPMGIRTLPLGFGSFLFSGSEFQDQPTIEDVPVEPDEPALIFYTSGSTGKPKGVVLPRRALSVFPEFCESLFKESISVQVLGVSIPMSHLGGPIYCNMLARYGVSLVIVEPFRPDRFLKAIERHRVTGFHSVPPVLASLLQVPGREGLDLSSLSWIAPMGMAVPKPLMLDLKRAFPSAHVIQGYGLTETAGPIIAVPFEDESRKLGSMGKLLVSGCQIRVVNEAGSEMPNMETGEIAIAGKCLMKGYLNRPELNAKVFKDGWFFTGDLAYKDNEGFFCFMGRKDDVINVGGEKIYPAEVEAAFLAHPKIFEACVIGVDSPKRGKAIKAFVEMFPGERIEPKELTLFLRSKLSRYKIPQEVVVVDMLPRTSSGKVAKAELKHADAKNTIFLSIS